MSAANCAEWSPSLHRLQNRDFLLEQVVGEIGERHVFLGRDRGQVCLDVRLQIHRHVERGARPVELPAHPAREVDLLGQVVVGGWSLHYGVTYRGSSS